MDELNALETDVGNTAAQNWEASVVGPGPAISTQPTTLPDMPVVMPTMPVAPSHEPVQEEDPFANLEASMAI